MTLTIEATVALLAIAVVILGIAIAGHIWTHLR